MTDKEMNKIFPFIKGKNIKVYYKLAGWPILIKANINTGCYLSEGGRFEESNKVTIKFIKKIEIVDNG